MNTPELEVHLNRLTAYFEGQNGWDFAELAPDAKAQWVKYIGGFTLDISNVEVTAKLSQEQSSRDRSNVATALLERGQGADTAVARLIMQGIRGF